MLVMAQSPGPDHPVNLGSGTGCSIKDLLGIILDNIDSPPEVVWDTSKISGDQMRVLDIQRATELGFNLSISLQAGIKDLIRWYRENEEKH